ncbi:MAG: hypothetical protein ACFFDS_06895 [Candidatus Thorarchaeota archaeon]
MKSSELTPEEKMLKKIQESYDDELDSLVQISEDQELQEVYIKQLLDRNKSLLESLGKVKILVERLLTQNKEFKNRVEILENEIKTQNSNGVKVVSLERYREMQNNANELGRSLPKLIKLIKLLNQENKLLKDKYSALEDEFEDLISERDDLTTKIENLNQLSQQEKIAELAELFPSEEIAEKIAKSLATSTARQELLSNGIEITKDESSSIEKQARVDLDKVAGFSNEQISKLVDLVVEINEKIENLSGTMVITSPTRRRADLDLSGTITDGEGKKSEEPPDRPDLEEVLDDILISG